MAPSCALKPPRFGEFGTDGVIIINNRPVKVPVGPVLSLIAIVVSVVIALGYRSRLAAEWPTLALWWYGRDAVPPAAAAAHTGGSDLRPAARLLSVHAAGVADGRGLAACRLALLTFAVGLFFFVTSRGSASSAGGEARRDPRTIRGLALAWALLLLTLAAQVYLGRFERLFDDHTIFAGITYTEAHVTLTGMLLVSIALALGAVAAIVAAFARAAGSLAGRRACCRRSCCIWATGAIGAYVEGFIVKPNELVREQPYIAHNIEFTRQAYGLEPDRPTRRFRPRRRSRRPTRRTTRRRCRTSGCGTGVRSRTRCGSSRKSAPTTTSPTSTSIAT